MDAHCVGACVAVRWSDAEEVGEVACSISNVVIILEEGRVDILDGFAVDGTVVGWDGLIDELQGFNVLLGKFLGLEEGDVEWRFHEEFNC